MSKINVFIILNIVSVLEIAASAIFLLCQSTYAAVICIGLAIFFLLLAFMYRESSSDVKTAKEPRGINKKSFCMFFGGGEIWFEHLDGLYEHTQAAMEKLNKDYESFKKPSAPSLIAVNLDETYVADELLSAVCEKLTDGEKNFTRVVFVGTDVKTRRKIKATLSDAAFALAFINDFEKAKEWLVSESYN